MMSCRVLDADILKTLQNSITDQCSGPETVKFENSTNTLDLADDLLFEIVSVFKVEQLEDNWLVISSCQNNLTSMKLWRTVHFPSFLNC